MSFFDVDTFLKRKNAEEVDKFRNVNNAFVDAPDEWVEILTPRFLTLHDVVSAYPGLTTRKLFGKVTVNELDELHRVARGLNFGQTSTFRWFTAEQNDSIRLSVKSNALSPGAIRFFNTRVNERHKLLI